MPTTTIRLDDDLKERIAVLADQAGMTPHAFIIDAVAATVQEAEQEAAFRRLADERWSTLVATGRSVPLEAAQAYVQARVRGRSARRPAPRKP